MYSPLHNSIHCINGCISSLLYSRVGVPEPAPCRSCRCAPEAVCRRTVTDGAKSAAIQRRLAGFHRVACQHDAKLHVDQAPGAVCRSSTSRASRDEAAAVVAAAGVRQVVVIVASAAAAAVQRGAMNCSSLRAAPLCRATPRTCSCVSGCWSSGLRRVFEVEPRAVHPA